MTVPRQDGTVGRSVHGLLVSSSLTSLFSTNMAISETSRGL